ncbi:MAG: WD40 repeat domain-containing protein [Gemmataceae bacterium]
MPIPLFCPQCTAGVRVTEEQRGGTITCPQCGQPFPVPAAASHREHVQESRPLASFVATIADSEPAFRHRRALLGVVAFVAAISLVAVSLVVVLISGAWQTSRSPEPDKPAEAETPVKERTLSCLALKAHESDVIGLAFTPEGRLVSAAQDGQALVWDAAAGKVLAQFSGAKDEFHKMALSPDGGTIALAGSKDTVQLYQLRNEQEPLTILQPRNQFVCSFVAFSANGKSLLSGHGDRRLRYWDLTTKSLLLEVPTGTANRHAVYSPDGKCIAMEVYEEGIQLLNLDGATLATLPPERDDTNRPFFIRSLAFTRDGKTLYVANDDGSVVFWDVASGKRRGELQHGSPSCLVALTQNDQLVATASNREVKLHDRATGHGDPHLGCRDRETDRATALCRRKIHRSTRLFPRRQKAGCRLGHGDPHLEGGRLAAGALASGSCRRERLARSTRSHACRYRPPSIDRRATSPPGS